jgi:hypothetical protein
MSKKSRLSSIDQAMTDAANANDCRIHILDNVLLSDFSIDTWEVAFPNMAFQITYHKGGMCTVAFQFTTDLAVWVRDDATPGFITVHQDDEVDAIHAVTLAGRKVVKTKAGRRFFQHRMLTVE